MSLSIGIVGLPNVGKSTLFNALTKKSVPAENFPFCTIDPSVGIVGVPDIRLDKLSKMSASEKTLPAAVEFVDIAGLVKGAAEGEGLGNQFLSHIREVDAILEVVRIFEDEDITHVHGDVHPKQDIDVINLELVMADLQTVEKRLNNIQRDVKKNDKEALLENNILEKVQTTLKEGKLAQTVTFTEEELAIVKSLHLLTMKPIFYVLNKKSGAYNLDEHTEERYQELETYLNESGAHWISVDVGVEHELKDVHSDDKIEFRREFGVVEDGVDLIIRKGYELLNLITFFTTGETETRGWTIPKDTNAKNAGAAIHSDFKDKFIRASVIPAEELLSLGSYAKAREEGKLRMEGKEYIVQDGDVIEFKI